MNPRLGRALLARGATAFAAAFVFVSFASGAPAEAPKLDTEDYVIPSADPGIELYIRNKHPAGIMSFPADKILLFVHGATYPAETAFDLPLRSQAAC
jgi:hypothetical protein